MTVEKEYTDLETALGEGLKHAIAFEAVTSPRRDGVEVDALLRFRDDASGEEIIEDRDTVWWNVWRRYATEVVDPAEIRIYFSLQRESDARQPRSE